MNCHLGIATGLPRFAGSEVAIYMKRPGLKKQQTPELLFLLTKNKAAGEASAEEQQC